MRNGTIGRLAPDGTVSVWCETGGQVNGLKVDSSGFIIGADAGAKRVLQIHPSGKPIEVLTDQFEGKPYHSPNDLCLDQAGNIYFSDPSNETPEAPIGGVYRIDKNRRVTRLIDNLKYPNGLAVAPDQKQLIVAETMTNRILAFDLTSDGRLEGGHSTGSPVLPLMGSCLMNLDGSGSLARSTARLPSSPSTANWWRRFRLAELR